MGFARETVRPRWKEQRRGRKEQRRGEGWRWPGGETHAAKKGQSREDGQESTAGLILISQYSKATINLQRQSPLASE